MSNVFRFGSSFCLKTFGTMFVVLVCTSCAKPEMSPEERKAIELLERAADAPERTALNTDIRAAFWSASITRKVTLCNGQAITFIPQKWKVEPTDNKNETLIRACDDEGQTVMSVLVRVRSEQSKNTALTKQVADKMAKSCGQVKLGASTRFSKLGSTWDSCKYELHHGKTIYTGTIYVLLDGTRCYEVITSVPPDRSDMFAAAEEIVPTWFKGVEVGSKE